MSIGLLNPKLPHANHEFCWRNVRDDLLTNTRLTNRHSLKHAFPPKPVPVGLVWSYNSAAHFGVKRLICPMQVLTFWPSTADLGKANRQAKKCAAHLPRQKSSTWHLTIADRTTTRSRQKRATDNSVPCMKVAAWPNTIDFGKICVQTSNSHCISEARIAPTSAPRVKLAPSTG